jgi:hypothetical protein
MSKLNAQKRNALPDTAFALPEKRAYPIPDRGHAQAALGRATTNATPDEQAKIRSAVKRKFADMTIKRKGAKQ